MMRERLKLLLTILLFLSFVSAGIYLYVRDGEKEINHNLEMVRKNYGLGKGIITKISSYKGHSIHIKYSIKNTQYKYEGGYDKNLDGLSVGDSIKIKYSIDSPQFVISELDKSYKAF